MCAQRTHTHTTCQASVLAHHVCMHVCWCESCMDECMHSRGCALALPYFHGPAFRFRRANRALRAGGTRAPGPRLIRAGPGSRECIVGVPPSLSREAPGLLVSEGEKSGQSRRPDASTHPRWHAHNAPHLPVAAPSQPSLRQHSPTPAPTLPKMPDAIFFFLAWSNMDPSS